MNEPTSKGKVLFDASFGAFEIELWPTLCPQTCRWFLQQVLEEAFDELRFTRIRAGIAADVSLPAGTFGDDLHALPKETHSRLRYTRKGLVGLRVTPSPAIFITLGETPQYQGVHSLFGCITASTRFVPWKLDLFHVNDKHEPLFPPTINSARIVDMPIADLRPRPSQLENNRTNRQQLVLQAASAAAAPARAVVAPKIGVRSDTSVLSFGDDCVAPPRRRPLKSLSDITSDFIIASSSSSSSSSALPEPLPHPLPVPEPIEPRPNPPARKRTERTDTDVEDRDTKRQTLPVDEASPSSFIVTASESELSPLPPLILSSAATGSSSSFEGLTELRFKSLEEAKQTPPSRPTTGPSAAKEADILSKLARFRATLKK